MFKQLHINIYLADALIYLEYQKMLKDLLSNKEKLLELANTPLNENCLAVILKKLPEKLFWWADIVLIEKLLNLDSTKDLPPSPNVNPLSGSTTSSSPSLTTSEISDYSLEEFGGRGGGLGAGGGGRDDELALIESFPPGNNNMTLEVVIREIKYLLNHNPLAENSPNNDLIYTIPEMFTDEHTRNYSSPPRYDDADDDLFDLKTDRQSIQSGVSKKTLVYENLYEVTNRVTPDKNVKKISSSNASLILEDFNPPLSDHELPFHIEIPGSGTLLSFSSENEEKVFNPGILISKGVHSLLPELSHRDSKAFKVINIFESPMEIFPCSYREDIRVLDVSCLHFYPP
ncbi:hypothetical protein Tco_0970116 [Tanacetum coccineum]